MRQLAALSLLSLLVASAGCAVDTGPSPSAPSASDGLSTTPGALEAAERITHELRLPGSDTAPGDVMAALPAESAGPAQSHANVTVHVFCDPGCVAGCGELGDEACAHSCCQVIVTTR